MNNNINGELPFTLEEYETFIGAPKSAYYVEKFALMQKGSKASWNWAAFFLSSIWLLYRKMYAIGIGAYLGSILLGRIHWTLPWILSICIGVFGNYLYCEHTHNKITEINKMGYDQQFRKIKLAEVGGVNIVIPIVLGVVYALIFIILIIGVLALASLAAI